MINVRKREISLEVENEKVTFNMFKALKDQSKSQYCCQIDTVDKSVTKKSSTKVTKHRKQPDKAYKILLEPINADVVCLANLTSHVTIRDLFK